MQEPLSLAKEAFLALNAGECDICFGVRATRDDPTVSKWLSNIFWWAYRRFILPDVPAGGADFFACNRKVRDTIAGLAEKNSFFVGLLFWMGFTRKFIAYERTARRRGKSSWSLRKKAGYFLDSLFNFSALPITALFFLGTAGMAIATVLGILVIIAKVSGLIEIHGYAATATMICFFGGVQAMGFAILGQYVWRSFENSTRRPLDILVDSQFFLPTRAGEVIAEAKATTKKPTGVRPWDRAYAGKNVLITGGLGFIGSALANRLVEAGARLTLVDAFLPEHGANWHNIAEIRNHPQVTVSLSDVNSVHSMREVCRGQEFVFHLASQVSHHAFRANPVPDIEVNIAGTAVLLETLKHAPNRPKLIYTGTRGQYGPQDMLPVPESALQRPLGLYELSKTTAERMIKIYTECFGIPSVTLRLANIYGPRSQVKNSASGVANWFVRLAVEGKPIPIMGTGKIKRDFLHIDDCVEALVAAGAADVCDGSGINIASGIGECFLDVGQILSRLAGVPINFIPFSQERALLEPGDFVADIRLAKEQLNWAPTIDLDTGVASYFDWLQRHASQYIPQDEPVGVRKLVS